MMKIRLMQLVRGLEEFWANFVLRLSLIEDFRADSQSPFALSGPENSDEDDFLSTFFEHDS